MNHIDKPQVGDVIEVTFNDPDNPDKWETCVVVDPRNHQEEAGVPVIYDGAHGWVSLDSKLWRWPADKKPKRDAVRDLYNEILREKSETLFRELVRVRRELGLDDEP